LGWIKTVNDPCCFLQKGTKNDMGIHVDDMLASFATEEQAVSFFGSLAKRWPGLTFKKLERLVGISFEVVQNAELYSVFMHQKPLFQTVLLRMGLENCNPKLTPAVPGMIFSKKDCQDADAKDSTGMLQSDYRSFLQAINYGANQTRFDIKQVVSNLASFLNNPGVVHKQALKHLAAYLKGTLDFGIEFRGYPSIGRVVEPVTVVYTDSSHGDCVDTKRSTEAFGTWQDNTPISVVSAKGLKVRSCINHSEVLTTASAIAPRDILESASASTPAEGHFDSHIRSVNKSQRDAVWIVNMTAELERKNRKEMPSTNIFIDNSGAIKLLKDPIKHSANKHIMHELQELRERIEEGNFNPVKVSTTDNWINCATKAVAGNVESRRQLSHLSAPVGKSPNFALQEKNQVLRPKHAFSSVRVGEASHPGPVEGHGMMLRSHRIVNWAPVDVVHKEQERLARRAVTFAVNNLRRVKSHMMLAERGSMKQQERRAEQAVVLARNNLRRIRFAMATEGPLVNPLVMVYEFATAYRDEFATAYSVRAPSLGQGGMLDE
jgi:hypothetical protein